MTAATKARSKAMAPAIRRHPPMTPATTAAMIRATTKRWNAAVAGGDTVGGAVVGGVVGGIAGNRIAGRGNRTAGTLIGGGLGAIAGGAIGNASDKKKCDAWWSSRTQYRGGGYQGGYYPGGYSTTYQHGGYGYGYGYYTPGVVVTTIITNGAPVVTETVETSTRTYYENVPVRKRYVAKKRWKPKAKPRCVC